jgi:hypothetical protein
MQNSSLFNDSAARYAKIKQQIGDFTIVQIGISFFFVDADSGQWTAEVFTVYLVPSTTGGRDATIKFQASAVEFLTRYKFDYDRVCFF